MGFFTSSSTSKTEHYNPVLDQYTQGYRSWSPFSFQTTDPAAFLEAYSNAETQGKAAQFGKAGMYEGFTPEAKKAAEEQAAREKSDQDASSSLLKQITSGKSIKLDPEMERLINQSYDYEQARMTESFQQGASQLAGSRGLRMTDTPVARPMLQQLGMAQLGISSARAGAKVQATQFGMQYGLQQQQFLEGVRQFQEQMNYNRWTSRLNYMYGGGMSGASQVKYTDTTKGTQTMSGFQQMVGLTNYTLGLTKAVGGAMASMGGAPVPPPA